MEFDLQGSTKIEAAQAVRGTLFIRRMGINPLPWLLATPLDWNQHFKAHAVDMHRRPGSDILDTDPRAIALEGKIGVAHQLFNRVPRLIPCLHSLLVGKIGSTSLIPLGAFESQGSPISKTAQAGASDVNAKSNLSELLRNVQLYLSMMSDHEFWVSCLDGVIGSLRSPTGLGSSTVKAIFITLIVFERLDSFFSRMREAKYDAIPGFDLRNVFPTNELKGVSDLFTESFGLMSLLSVCTQLASNAFLLDTLSIGDGQLSSAHFRINAELGEPAIAAKKRDSAEIDEPATKSKQKREKKRKTAAVKAAGVAAPAQLVKMLPLGGGAAGGQKTLPFCHFFILGSLGLKHSTGNAFACTKASCSFEHPAVLTKVLMKKVLDDAPSTSLLKARSTVADFVAAVAALN